MEKPADSMLTSGQIGRANRVSEKALRVYEKKGLLTPLSIDEQTGRRHYDIEQSVKLDLILELQQIGLSLDEIVDVSESQDIAHLRDVIEAHCADLDRQIERLEMVRRVAREHVENCDLYLDPPPLNQIMLERLPERRIVKFALPDDIRVALTRDDTSKTWEETLRFTRQQIVDRGYPAVLYRDVCSLLRTDGLDDPDTALVSHTFVLVGEACADIPDERVDILPAGSYLTLYHDCAYGDDGSALSRERVVRMVEYAHKKRMVVDGMAFGESLCRWPRLLTGGTRLLHRLCIPVRYER